MPYRLPKDFAGYEAGTELRDVTLKEAREMECNRCGDCCAGDRPDVKKDPETGLPLFTWESPDTAADEKRSQTRDPMRYAGRFNGQPLLIPIVRTETGCGEGKKFEKDENGRPYTSFHCRALIEEGDHTSCAIYDKRIAPNTSARPLNCGSFPVFGLETDEAIAENGYFVPPTGALPRCTWYGLRVTGPWKDTPFWRLRWRLQKRGMSVLPLKQALRNAFGERDTSP